MVIETTGEVARIERYIRRKIWSLGEELGMPKMVRKLRSSLKFRFFKFDIW